MTPTHTRLHFIESERVLLGHHLASVARREASSPRVRPAASEAGSGMSAVWIPVGGMVLLTTAMVAALVIPH